MAVKSAQHGVYVAPHRPCPGEATSPGLDLGAEGVHTFAYRRQDNGPTGFRADTAAGQVVMSFLQTCWIYDHRLGFLRHGLGPTQDAVSDAVPRLAIHEPDAELLEDNARVEPYQKELKMFALRQRHGRAAVKPEAPKIAGLPRGYFDPIPSELLTYLRSHCKLLLLGSTSAWGSYFYAINGSTDARRHVVGVFQDAGIPVYEVASELDLPEW